MNRVDLSIEREGWRKNEEVFLDVDRQRKT